MKIACGSSLVELGPFSFWPQPSHLPRLRLVSTFPPSTLLLLREGEQVGRPVTVMSAVFTKVLRTLKTKTAGSVDRRESFQFPPRQRRHHNF